MLYVSLNETLDMKRLKASQRFEIEHGCVAIAVLPAARENTLLGFYYCVRKLV